MTEQKKNPPANPQTRPKAPVRRARTIRTAQPNLRGPVPRPGVPLARKPSGQSPTPVPQKADKKAETPPKPKEMTIMDVAQGAMDSKVHPLAVVAATHIEENEDGTLKLSDKGPPILKVQLAKLFEQPDLRHAMESLVDLAAHIQKDRKSPKVAEVLLTIAAEACPALLKQKSDASVKQSLRVKANFDKLQGNRQQKLALPSKEKPKGSVSLSSLLPTRHIR